MKKMVLFVVLGLMLVGKCYGLTYDEAKTHLETLGTIVSEQTGEVKPDGYTKVRFVVKEVIEVNGQSVANYFAHELYRKGDDVQWVNRVPSKRLLVSKPSQFKTDLMLYLADKKYENLRINEDNECAQAVLYESAMGIYDKKDIILFYEDGHIIHKEIQ